MDQVEELLHPIILRHALLWLHAVYAVHKMYDESIMVFGYVVPVKQICFPQKSVEIMPQDIP